MWWREYLLGSVFLILVLWAGPCALRCGWETGNVLHNTISENK